jgi:cytochrome c oxidase subunit III
VSGRPIPAAARTGGGPRRPPGPPLRGDGPAGSNAVFGTLVFLAAETMLFAGLVSSFLVLRGGQTTWPPPDQPRLPLGLTAVNTLVLLTSGWTMWRGVAAARGGFETDVERWLLVTAALGTAFVLVQGIEWIRLVSHGLTLGRSAYGGLFIALIGTHGAHVLGGVVTLFVVWLLTWRGRLTTRLVPVVTAASLYWLFVVAVWPILYVLVYVW